VDHVAAHAPNGAGRREWRRTPDPGSRVLDRHGGRDSQQSRGWRRGWSVTVDMLLGDNTRKEVPSAGGTLAIFLSKEIKACYSF
jgi:hypothetical protein